MCEFEDPKLRNDNRSMGNTTHLKCTYQKDLLLLLLLLLLSLLLLLLLLLLAWHLASVPPPVCYWC